MPAGGFARQLHHQPVEAVKAAELVLEPGLCVLVGVI